MDPSTPARSTLHYAQKNSEDTMNTVEDMVMYNEMTIKKRTQHELE